MPTTFPRLQPLMVTRVADPSTANTASKPGSCSRGPRKGATESRLDPVSSVGFQPGEHLLGMLIRREDRVEDVLDTRVANDQGQSLIERFPVGGECGQPERTGKFERRVGKHLERQAEPFDDLALIVSVLAGQAEYLSSTGIEKLPVVITEATRFGCAATRPGNRIPARRQLDAGPAGQRIYVDHGATGSQRIQGHRPA